MVDGSDIDERGASKVIYVCAGIQGDRRRPRATVGVSASVSSVAFGKWCSLVPVVLELRRGYDARARHRNP